jgi:glycosyltransferase involved in cell wall biosynthesis
MAMGKPAVVQYTGPSRFLPDADGLFRFRSVAGAVQALAEAEANYEHHGRQARALVEEYFDAEKVLRRVLERALA